VPRHDPANSCVALLGNPVSAANKCKVETIVDYEAPGIRFARTWRSNVEPYYAFAGNSRSDGRLPWGWTHSYASRVVFDCCGQLTHYFTTDGSKVPLYQESAGIYLAQDASGIQARGEGANPISVYFPDGSYEVHIYHACTNRHRLEAVYDANGVRTGIEYPNECSLAPTSITGSFGHTLQIQYATYPLDYGHTVERISALVDPAGGTINFTYVATGNGAATGQLESVTYQDFRYLVYHYDDPDAEGYLSGISDGRAGGTRYATFDYNSLRQAVGTTHSAGSESWTFTYASDHTTATDASGNTTTFWMQPGLESQHIIGSIELGGVYAGGYVNETSGQYRPISVTDAANKSTTFGYDTYHRTVMTEAANTALERTTTYGYLNDTSQLKTTVQSPSVCNVGTPLYKTVTMGYFPGTQLVNSVTESGYKLQSGSCQPVSRTTNIEFATTFSQMYGLPTAIRGPRPGVADDTLFGYHVCTSGHHCGQLAWMQNAVGHLTTFNIYDAHGRIRQVTDSNGVISTIGYDTHGRLTSVWEDPPTGPTRITTFAYNAAGLLETVTTPNGVVLVHGYYESRQLAYIRRDNDGAYIAYGYDAAGNRTIENVHEGASSGYTLRKQIETVYDTRNHIDRISTAVSVTELLFDGVGNLVHELDPNYNPTTHVYDDLHRLHQTTDALSGITSYGYNNQDQLTSVTAPNGAVTTYVYDDLGNLLSVTSPDSGTTTYVSDEAGNVTSETNANGITKGFTYDALNRPTYVDYPGTGLDVAQTYDQDGQIGRLTTMVDGGGTTTFGYDAFGNMLIEAKQIAGATYVTYFTYDDADLLTSITYPSGLSVSYARNLGEVASVSGNYGGGFTIASGASYRPFGPLTDLTFGNGLVLSRNFDQEYRLTAQTTTAVQDLIFNRDAAGNVDWIGDAVYGLHQSISQDALHRIDAESGGTYGSKNYFYDANGNRWSQTGNTPQSLTYSANSNRQATQDGLTVTLDAAGNTLENPAENLSFTYGAHNRMLQAYVGGVLQGTYTYNGRGQRIIKIEAPSAGGRTLVYHYGLDGNLLGETILDSGGAKIGERDYVWLDSMPVAQIERTFSGGVMTGSQLVYIHADHLNTPRLATNAAGTVVWRWDSDAFGVGNANLNPDGDGIQTNIRLRFPGQYRDDESGLNYNYFRDYDAVTGRYVESDPIGLEGGFNTYAYVDSNPMNWIDPEGLMGRGIPTPPTKLPPGGVIRFGGGAALPSVRSWGVGGCLGTSCITYDSRDSAPNVEVPFPPELGGGLSFCTTTPAEGPTDVCRPGDDEKPVSFNIGLGKALGLSFGNDGSVCLNLGVAIALPFGFSLGTGEPLWE
jgi:RHS repeat-associated protein